MLWLSTTVVVVTLHVLVSIPQLQLPACAAQKNAVIGDGINSTFVSKCLIDYDKKDCTIDSLAIFDPATGIR